MIDLHTHLLPYIDDGACNLQEALHMAEDLYTQKVFDAVCTPHFDPSVMPLQDFIEKRASAMASMASSRLHLISASETMLHEYLFHYPDLSELCIAGGRYLLLELPYDRKWDAVIYEMVKRLMDHYDITPVIAHIERYPAAKRTKCIRKLINLECMIQMNTSTVLSKETDRKALKYIRKGLVDVLGSDCHNRTTRPPVFAEAFEKIRFKLGPSYCDKLEYNAKCIIDGIDIRKRNEYVISQLQ